MTPGLRLERPGELRSIADFRRRAAELAVWACNGARGRPSLGDPVYQAVTEDRQEQTAAAARRWDRTPADKRQGRRPFFRHPWINRTEHKTCPGGSWRKR